MAGSGKTLKTALFSAGAVLSLTATIAVTATTAAGAQRRTDPPASALRDVMLIGNSGGGTVSFLDGTSFDNLGSVNVIPDLAERLRAMNPIERAAYEIVKLQKGGDRFVDDITVSPDGRVLYVSRSNLADVVAFDLTTGRQLWRFKVNGHHADHMALSPDGRQLVVSATTAQEAHVLDPATGRQVGRFATGTYPHGNDYSPDGARIYNASIGVTAIPQALEGLKGSRRLTVVDARTLRVIRTYEFAHGVRPAVFTPDEKFMYVNLSYLNGFAEYDLTAGRITRTVNLPFSAAGQALHPDRYPQNSAHHGMALSGDASKICDAGTINDYVAIVSRPELTTDRIIPVGHQPYWAASSADGRHCLVTNSKDNTVSVISYETARELRRVAVGNYPQRERLAKVAGEVLAALTPTVG